MDFIVACVLFLLSVVGIIFLCQAKQLQKHKKASIIGIVCLSIFAAACALYLAVTVFFVLSIR